MRFLRHDRIYRSDVSSLLFTPGAFPAFRSGRCQGIEHAGKNAPSPSSAMSSGRLFLDRVGRHQSPSPLHRHGQNNTHPIPAPAKQNISTLQRIGHFYFALTCLDPATLVLGSSGPINLFLTPAPHGCIVKMDGDRSKRLRPQDPDLAGMSQDGEYVIPHWG